MIPNGFHWIGSGRRPTPPAGGPLIFKGFAATGTRVTFATSRHSARLTPPRRATLASLSRAHCPSSRRQFYFAKWTRQRRRLAERSGRGTFLFRPGLNSRHGFVTHTRTTQILHRTPSAKHTRARARSRKRTVRSDGGCAPPHSNEAAAARLRGGACRRRASHGLGDSEIHWESMDCLRTP